MNLTRPKMDKVKHGARTDLTSEKIFKGWGQYCEEIGITQQSANNWLRNWFPEQLDLSNKPITFNQGAI